MKKLQSMILAAAIAGVVTVPLRAQDVAPAAPTIGDASSQQEQIRVRTSSLASQVEAVLDEFITNGLSTGDELQTLKQMRDTLGTLSAQQMKEVVDLLRHADQSKDDTPVAKTDLVSAETEQKQIITKLRMLLGDFQRQQSRYE